MACSTYDKLSRSHFPTNWLVFSNIEPGSFTFLSQQQHLPTSWYFWLLLSVLVWPPCQPCASAQSAGHTTWFPGLHPAANRAVTVSHCPSGNRVWFACERVIQSPSVGSTIYDSSDLALRPAKPTSLTHNLASLASPPVASFERAAQVSSSQVVSPTNSLNMGGWMQKTFMLCLSLTYLNSLSNWPAPI